MALYLFGNLFLNTNFAFLDLRHLKGRGGVMPPMARLNRILTLHYPSICVVSVWRGIINWLKVCYQISGGYTALNQWLIILVLLYIQKVSALTLLIGVNLGEYRILGRRFFQLPLLSSIHGQIGVGFCDGVVVSSRNVFWVSVVFYPLRCGFSITVLTKFLIVRRAFNLIHI
jgi:hypothetical protein